MLYQLFQILDHLLKQYILLIKEDKYNFLSYSLRGSQVEITVKCNIYHRLINEHIYFFFKFIEFFNQCIIL